MSSFVLICIVEYGIRTSQAERTDQRCSVQLVELFKSKPWKTSGLFIVAPSGYMLTTPDKGRFILLSYYEIIRKDFPTR